MTFLTAEADAVIQQMLREGYDLRLKVYGSSSNRLGVESWNVSFLHRAFRAGTGWKVVPTCEYEVRADEFCDVHSGDFYHLGISGCIELAAESARLCAQRLGISAPPTP